MGVYWYSSSAIYIFQGSLGFSYEGNIIQYSD
jgi:hypothetical protein